MRFTALLLVAGLSACSGAEPVNEQDESASQSVAATTDVADRQREASMATSATELPDDLRDRFEPARQAIDRFCDNDAACIEDQRQNLARYVKIMVAFDDPNLVVAERCMRSGKVDGGVDWTVAAPCMQNAAKGKPLGGRLE